MNDESWLETLARELPCVFALLVITRWFLKAREGSDNRVYRLITRGLRVEDTTPTRDDVDPRDLEGLSFEDPEDGLGAEDH